jgi:hypothetical protein
MYGPRSITGTVRLRPAYVNVISVPQGAVL